MGQFTVLLLAATTLAALDQRDAVRLAGHWFEGPVRQAVQGAALRLAAPACAAVMTDFSDGDGRPLRDRLAELRLDAPAYTRSVFFYDGSDDAPCRRPRVYAFTTPGSRVVRACPSLGWLAAIDRERAEDVVIHEVLHTLGLEENPPTSQQITATVERRCRPQTATRSRPGER
jgi:hypothetical protein